MNEFFSINDQTLKKIFVFASILSNMSSLPFITDLTTFNVEVLLVTRKSIN